MWIPRLRPGLSDEEFPEPPDDVLQLRQSEIADPQDGAREAKILGKDRDISRGERNSLV